MQDYHPKYISNQHNTYSVSVGDSSNTIYSKGIFILSNEASLIINALQLKDANENTIPTTGMEVYASDNLDTGPEPGHDGFIKTDPNGILDPSHLPMLSSGTNAWVYVKFPNLIPLSSITMVTSSWFWAHIPAVYNGKMTIKVIDRNNQVIDIGPSPVVNAKPY